MFYITVSLINYHSIKLKMALARRNISLKIVVRFLQHMRY